MKKIYFFALLTCLFGIEIFCSQAHRNFNAMTAQSITNHQQAQAYHLQQQAAAQRRYADQSAQTAQQMKLLQEQQQRAAQLAFLNKK